MSNVLVRPAQRPLHGMSCLPMIRKTPGSLFPKSLWTAGEIESSVSRNHYSATARPASCIRRRCAMSLSPSFTRTLRGWPASSVDCWVTRHCAHEEQTQWANPLHPDHSNLDRQRRVSSTATRRDEKLISGRQSREGRCAHFIPGHRQSRLTSPRPEVPT